jgi:actin-related protein 6
MTEPYMNLNFIRETMDQIFFEEYEVASFARYDRKMIYLFNKINVFDLLAATLSAYRYECDTNSNYVLVVDSGFSFTHIIPFYQGRKILDGMTR